MKERNIAVCIILSIITCGIYTIVWFVQMTDEAANASEDNSMSGGVALLLTIVTCGIYQIYWAYKMGKMLKAANDTKGISASDNSVLYLILDVLGLSLVDYCLMQAELNKLAE